MFYLGSGYIAESEVGHGSRTTTARDISRGILQYGAPALLAKRRYLTWPKALHTISHSGTAILVRSLVEMLA